MITEGKEERKEGVDENIYVKKTKEKVEMKNEDGKKLITTKTKRNEKKKK